MDIQSVPLVGGELPDKDNPHKRYVVLRVTNGSAGLARNVVRIVHHTEASDSTAQRLRGEHRGLTFKVVAAGRLEFENGEVVMHRGSDMWDPSIDGANSIRLVLKGRVRMVAEPPDRPPRPAIAC